MTKTKTLMVNLHQEHQQYFPQQKDIILELRIKLVSETQLLATNILSLT
jgi:hypothetical protein